MSTYYCFNHIFYGVLDTSVKGSVYKDLLIIILMPMDEQTDGRVDGWIIMANNRHWSTMNLG